MSVYFFVVSLCLQIPLHGAFKLLYVFMSLCLYVFMSLCLYAFMSLCFYVFMSLCPFHFFAVSFVFSSTVAMVHLNLSCLPDFQPDFKPDFKPDL